MSEDGEERSEEYYKQPPLLLWVASSALSLFAALLAGIPVLLVIAVLPELLSNWWHPFPGFPLLAYGVVLGFTFSALLGQVIDVTDAIKAGRERFPNILMERKNFLVDLALSFLILTAATIEFGGFNASTSDYWSWLWYGVKWLTDNLTLNVSQAYEWQITDIEATTFWTRLLPVIFSLGVTFIAIRAIVLGFQGMTRRRQAKQSS